METVDDIVRAAIEDMFPNQTVPDQHNFLPDGSQFKAPDHSVLDGKVLIERKSRNALDRSQFYYKLQEIAKEQGKPFIGFGMIRTDKIISELPDPVAATRKIVDYSLNQMMKAVREARQKFEDHSRFIDNSERTRILTIADNTQISGSTAIEEHFLGRKMGGYAQAQDETGIIDAILFVKTPQYVFDEPNSYWFKCLMKERLQHKDRDVVSRIAAGLHHRIAHHASFYPKAVKIRNSHYRPLLV